MNQQPNTIIKEEKPAYSVPFMPHPIPPAHIVGGNITKVVPVRRVLIAGIILGVFHPPVIGLVYALCFVFTKATRRAAVYVAIWTIVWTVLYGFALGFLGSWITQSRAIQSLQSTGAVNTARTTGTTSPTGGALPAPPSR